MSFHLDTTANDVAAAAPRKPSLDDKLRSNYFSSLSSVTEQKKRKLDTQPQSQYPNRYDAKKGE
jgi:hypothetical protein